MIEKVRPVTKETAWEYVCLSRGFGKEKSSLHIFNHTLPIRRDWGTEKPQTHPPGPLSIVNGNPLLKVFNPGFMGFSKLWMCWRRYLSSKGEHKSTRNQVRKQESAERINTTIRPSIMSVNRIIGFKWEIGGKLKSRLENTGGKQYTIKKYNTGLTKNQTDLLKNRIGLLKFSI